ncbi:GerMN domain-containing protein [Thermodesulfovibrio sp.]|uniref:GerMN domain-containing protein n=1 Tax=Thermodesulfovibrio sp. TaxID=2067987 RepID=UPI003C7DC1B0
MNKKLITILALILVAILTTIVYFTLFKHEKKTFEKFQTEQAMVNFKIYLPSSNSIVIKEIYLEKESSELKNIERILEIFLSELPSKETKILGIYRDKENVVYIDLSKNFAIPQSMLEEYFLLKSLYKTLKENFPWIKDIKILIESREIETISGHISIASSLKEAVEEN